MLRLNKISKQLSTQRQMIKVPSKQNQQVFNKLLSQGTKCVMLFTGEPSQDGTNWCSDCQNIAPLYPTFVQQCKANGLPFYVFLVGDRPTWKNPEHFFRKSKITKLTNIPTMGLFDGKKITNRLGDDKEISNTEMRAMLFE